MKRIGIMVTIFILVLCGFGCGENESASDDKETEAGIGEKSAVIRDCVVTLNDEMKDVIDDLGDDYEYTESKSNFNEGYDKMYEYDEVIITSFPTGKDDIVDDILIASPEVEISKDIHVGDTFEKVKEVFGTEYDDLSATYCCYMYEDYGITFFINEGLVTSIELFSV